MAGKTVEKKGKRPVRRLDLVTGACGFTGSHLVKLLLEEGRKVIATDLPGAFEHPKTKFIFKNIGQYANGIVQW